MLRRKDWYSTVALKYPLYFTDRIKELCTSRYSSASEIKKDNDIFIVNNKYTANKLIFAVTIQPLIKLIKNLSDIDYSKYFLYLDL